MRVPLRDRRIPLGSLAEIQGLGCVAAVTALGFTAAAAEGDDAGNDPEGQEEETCDPGAA